VSASIGGAVVRACGLWAWCCGRGGAVVVVDRGGEGAGQDVKVAVASSVPKKPNWKKVN